MLGPTGVRIACAGCGPLGSLRSARCILVSALFAAPAGASGSPSAAALLKQSLDAADAVGSVHLAEKTTGGTRTQRLVGSLSAPAAAESLGGDVPPLSVELVGGTIYVSGGSSALESALQLTAAEVKTAAGKWIAVQSADSPYASLAQSLTLTSILDAFTPAGRGLHLGKKTKVGRVNVIPIVGAPNGSLARGTSGSTALFVSTKAPHLPVGASIVLANQSSRVTQLVIFTAWGAPVKLTPPASSISFSTLVGA